MTHVSCHRRVKESTFILLDKTISRSADVVPRSLHPALLQVFIIFSSSIHLADIDAPLLR